MPGGADYPFVGERRLIERGTRGRIPYEIMVSYPVFELSGVDYVRPNAALKGWVDELAGVMRPPADGSVTPGVGWYFEGGHVVHVVARRLSTVQVQGVMYSGGAHSNTERVAWHVDLPTGRLLSLDDIFDRDSGWQEGVAHRVRVNLKRRFEESPGFGESLEPGALAKLVAESRRWIFGKDKVILTFNPYEVGPFLSGPYDVELSYEQLATYVRKDGPLGSKAR